MFLELKIPALRCGISSGEYWDMSLDDISDVMKAYKEEKDSRLEEYACMVYSQAILNASAILSPKDFPKSVQEAFPKLFGGSQPIQQDWREMKAYMQSFARQRKARKGVKE